MRNSLRPLTLVCCLLCGLGSVWAGGSGPLSTCGSTVAEHLLQTAAEVAFNADMGPSVNDLLPPGRVMRAAVEDVAAETSTNVYKHSFKYADKVRIRGAQDPVSHNFPYSFDDAILATKPIPKNNGYQMFQLNGTMNGKNGVFEIGLTKDGVIDHRFFRPVK